MNNNLMPSPPLVSLLPGNPPQPCPELLTEAEAIRYLRLDQSGIKHPRLSLRRYRRMGKLFAVKIGKKVLYRRKELEKFVDRLQKEDPR